MSVSSPASTPGSDIPVGPPVGAADRVSFEILRALELHQLVPGQRMVETELAVRYGVGRNAVREAIQRLAAKGIVDVSRNRSPAIRILSVPETLEVLELAEELFGLLARVAARGFDSARHAPRLRSLLSQLHRLPASYDRQAFSQIRREFYRALLDIGSNRELQRHFATIHMQIIYAQYESAALYDTRREDYSRICELVADGDISAAEKAARRHVNRVRKLILGLAAAQARKE